MTILFYRREMEGTDSVRTELPRDLQLRIWKPAEDGLPQWEMCSARRLAFWLQNEFGCFASKDFAELSIWRERRIIHRLIVTPRWFRFPFMREDDLQVGDVWTLPEERGKGLARAAVAHAHFLFGSPARRFWYVTAADNDASVRLAEASDYRLVGTGRRTRPLGLSPFGRFHLDVDRAAALPCGAAR